MYLRIKKLLILKKLLLVVQDPMEGYWITRNIIPEFQAKYFANLLRSYDINFTKYGDVQCPMSICGYVLPVSEVLLFMLTDKLQSICGKKLLPTYSYMRIYSHAETLKPHRDRPSCEYSLTLNLDCDIEWPFYVENLVSKEYCKINMRPGDGVLYMGCKVEHFRNHFEGYKCVQVFLHYVDANGPYINYKFDRRQLTKPISVKPCPTWVVFDIITSDLCDNLRHLYNEHAYMAQDNSIFLSQPMFQNIDNLVSQGIYILIKQMKDLLIWNDNQLSDSGYTLSLHKRGMSELTTSSAIAPNGSGWRIGFIIIALSDGNEVHLPQEQKIITLRKGCATIFRPHHPYKFVIHEDQAIILTLFIVTPSNR